MLEPAATGPHGLGQAREDVLDISVVVLYPRPFPVGSAISEIQRWPECRPHPLGVRVTSHGWISIGCDRRERIVGIVAIQEAPVAQDPLAVCPMGSDPDPMSLLITPMWTSGKLVPPLPSGIVCNTLIIWEVLASAFCLGSIDGELSTMNKMSTSRSGLIGELRLVRRLHPCPMCRRFRVAGGSAAGCTRRAAGCARRAPGCGVPGSCRRWRIR